MKSVSAFLMVLFVASFILTFVSPAAQYDPEVYRVQKALRTRGYDPGVLDGMDIALLLIDKKNNAVEYAGAYNPLYLYRKGNLIDLKSS